MENATMPTKTNLIKLQNTLALSKQGSELLEKKRQILIRQMQKQEEEMKKRNEEAVQLFKEGYQLLENANMEIGIETMMQLADGMQEENGLDIKYLTIMGVDIPSIVYEKKKMKIHYGLYSTTISVDKAILKFNEIKEILIELAQIQNTVERLKESINKVQKRSNSLKNIQIPKYQEDIRQIQNALEEKEREEFARLKVIKKRKM